MEILQTVTVGLGDRSYPIHIGRGLLRNAGKLVDIKNRAVFVLADENVRACAEMVAGSLREAGARHVNIMSIAGGEQAKSLDGLEEVLNWLLDNGVDRQSV